MIDSGTDLDPGLTPFGGPAQIITAPACRCALAFRKLSGSKVQHCTWSFFDREERDKFPFRAAAFTKCSSQPRAETVP